MPALPRLRSGNCRRVRRPKLPEARSRPRRGWSETRFADWEDRCRREDSCESHPSFRLLLALQTACSLPCRARVPGVTTKSENSCAPARFAVKWQKSCLIRRKECVGNRSWPGRAIHRIPPAQARNRRATPESRADIRPRNRPQEGWMICLRPRQWIRQTRKRAGPSPQLAYRRFPTTNCSRKSLVAGWGWSIRPGKYA